VWSVVFESSTSRHWARSSDPEFSTAQHKAVTDEIADDDESAPIPTGTTRFRATAKPKSGSSRLTLTANSIIAVASHRHPSEPAAAA
jgi:hypothetical protein